MAHDTLRVADSDANRGHFGSQDAGEVHGTSGYPLMRVVVLMAVRSHLLTAASFGPYNIDERTYARALWGSVPDHSLVLVDRNYLQADVLIPMMSGGTQRHWMTRAKSNTVFRQIRKLGSETTSSRWRSARKPGRRTSRCQRTSMCRQSATNEKGFSRKSC